MNCVYVGFRMYTANCYKRVARLVAAVS